MIRACSEDRAEAGEAPAEECQLLLVQVALFAGMEPLVLIPLLVLKASSDRPDSYGFIFIVVFTGRVVKGHEHGRRTGMSRRTHRAETSGDTELHTPY